MRLPVKVWGVTALAVAAAVFAAATGGCHRRIAARQEERAAQELVLWSYYETEAQKQGMDRLVEGFNLSQQGYALRWEYVPMTDFNKRLSMAYAEEDLPDLVVIDNPDMPMFIQLGMFEDLTKYASDWELDQAYYPAAVETVSYEGAYYGLPFNCNNLGLIYDRKALEQAGVAPPSSWEELREAARRLTTDRRSGFVMSAIEGEQGAFQILPWILSAGEKKEELGGGKTAQAYEFLYDMIRDGSLPRDCINMSQTDVARRFIAGEAAMMENGPWVFPMLDEAGIEYGVCPLPAKERPGVVAGGENIGVVKGKNIAGAAAFLEYCMNTDEVEQFCAASCVLPARISQARRLVREDPRLEVFECQMRRAVPRTSIPAWSGISPAVSRALYRMVSEELTPQEAAAELRRGK